MANVTPFVRITDGADPNDGHYRDAGAGDFIVIPSACAGVGTLAGADDPDWSLAHDGDDFLAFTETADGAKRAAMTGRMSVEDAAVAASAGVFNAVVAGQSTAASSGLVESFESRGVYGLAFLTGATNVGGSASVVGVHGSASTTASGTVAGKTIGVLGAANFTGGSGGDEVGVWGQLPAPSTSDSRIAVVGAPSNATLPAGAWAAYFEGAVQHVGDLDLNGNLDVSGTGLVGGAFTVNNDGIATGDFSVLPVGGGSPLFIVDVSTGLTTVGALTAGAIGATSLTATAAVQGATVTATGVLAGNSLTVNGTSVITSALVGQNFTALTVDNLMLDGSTVTNASGNMTLSAGGALIVSRAASASPLILFGKNADTSATLTFNGYQSAGTALGPRITMRGTLLDLDCSSTAAETADLGFRVGRGTNTSGTLRSEWYLGNNSSTVQARLDHKTGTFAIADAMSIGSSSFGGGPKWDSGAGSPEGVVTAVVGSLFSRTDGGAGTSLYVKESGTGSTGWAAK